MISVKELTRIRKDYIQVSDRHVYSKMLHMSQWTNIQTHVSVLSSMNIAEICHMKTIQRKEG